MSSESRRLALALLLSLLIHLLLLSLTFGGQGLGLPGFSLPWQERRIEAPDLSVVLMPAQVAATEPAGAADAAGTADTAGVEPPQPASIEPTAADGPAATLSLSDAPSLAQTPEAVVPGVEAPAPAKPEPEVAPDAPVATAPLRSLESAAAAPTPVPAPPLIALERSDKPRWVVPAVPPVPMPVIAAAPAASSPEAVVPAPRDAGVLAQEQIDAQAQERAAELARLDRLQREAVRIEAAKLETARVEADRQEAARQAAVRQAAAQQEASRQEAARREAQRIEAARLEAERIEAARLEAERQEAARQPAARQTAAQQEASRQEAERQEAARQAAARRVPARVDAAQEDDARREAARRAMGRQLDEEAARREAASKAAGPPSRLAPSSSSARRGRLFGRTDANAELVLYAEAWARKIQLNMTFDMVREAVKRPHTDPLVTVAIRSDGSVESVTFVISSGVAEIDEAIRRVVESQLPYRAFPPALAREFDVIEIRRTWQFDMAIRLF